MFNMGTHVLQVICALACLSVLGTIVSAEELLNGDFEHGVDNWNHCWGFQCELMNAEESRFGTKSMKVSQRTDTWQGPSQDFHPTPGKFYKAKSYIKILKDSTGDMGQSVQLEISFAFPGDKHSYFNVALQNMATVEDGWILLQGDFQAPNEGFDSATFYYQGPKAGVEFAVDSASVTEITVDRNYRQATDSNINKLRKSDLTVRVTAASGIDKSKVEIRVLQTKKSFPFGTAVNSWRYVEQAEQKYRDFIHQHFNWATLENALKWRQLEWSEGQYTYDRALQTLHGLKDHGLKIRGHNMIWAVEEYVPAWLKTKSLAQINQTVHQHIRKTMDMTKGLLEHWDVNNEMLHDQWYVNKFQDRDYNFEIFRFMHQVDPYPKLFLNDYSVVGSGAATSAYRQQAQRFKDANVFLYGIGVQSHFGRGVEPVPSLIKERLDLLAEVGLPLWTTELDTCHDDENVRADYYEQALRSLYSHPSIEGIIFWGFWGDIQSGGQCAALVTGPELTLTAAGRRVFDLWENEWTTDETHVLSQVGDHFTVRGFHGDYEVRVIYQGRELQSLTKKVTLGKNPETVTLSVHT